MLGASRREWLVVVGALALGAALLLLSRGRPLADTKRVSVAVTLITSDRHEVACALDGEVLGFRCGYGSNHERVNPPPSKEKLLGPYVSVDRHVVLVPALFEQPEILARYEREPPRSKARSRLVRFTATCQVDLLTRVPKVDVRFGRGKWSTENDVWLAKAHSCSVKD
jgi:hypothetical protein